MTVIGAPTRVAGEGQQIADYVVLVRRYMALLVDHVRQPAQVAVDVLGLVSDHLCGDEHTEHQHAGHKRQDFGQRHLLHPQSFISDEKSLSLLEPITSEHAPKCCLPTFLLSDRILFRLGAASLLGFLFQDFGDL